MVAAEDTWRGSERPDSASPRQRPPVAPGLQRGHGSAAASAHQPHTLRVTPPREPRVFTHLLFCTFDFVNN